MFGKLAVNCIFNENTATVGGGFNFGKAVNCLFYNNTAESGGGFSGEHAINCTITRNNAVYGGGMQGGAAYNCIIWGNSPTETSGTSVTYSCVSRDISFQKFNNIVANPGFVNPGIDNYRLRSDSPCIDAGTESGAPLTDYIGRVRPNGAGVDMGAYEYYSGDGVNAASGMILRVDAQSSHPAPDGSDWDKAYPDIQSAVDNAPGNGAEIWVAKGIYTASRLYTTVTLKKGISVFGGFEGVEVDREERNWEDNETVVDGEDLRRCVMADEACIIDGFTLRNGYSDMGGAMLGGSVRNCVLSDNHVSIDGGALYGGYAENCLFYGNTASNSGGALYLGKAVNCEFVENSAKYSGAVYDSVLTECVLRANTAQNMGGGALNAHAVNSLFLGNSAAEGGGMAGGWAINCTFVDNSSSNGGGALNGYRTSRVLYGMAVNCIFWNNTQPQTNMINSVTYSASTESMEGEGNIVVDNPLFINAQEGDYHLAAGSSCIDVGTSEHTLDLPVVDMSGTPRPQGAGYDMGVYEYVFLAEEGESEGEAIVEGEPEGEPPVEGEREGEPPVEGESEGEPLIEGESEGEPLLEGEPPVEGESEGEPLIEGESEGEVQVEGESEGEPVSPSAEESMILLAASFGNADLNRDDALSFEEAVAVASGLQWAVFAGMDANGDGVLDKSELGIESGCGCDCNKSAFSPAGLKQWIGDFFLAGLALGVLVVMQRR